MSDGKKQNMLMSVFPMFSMKDILIDSLVQLFTNTNQILYSYEIVTSMIVVDFGHL